MLEDFTVQVTKSTQELDAAIAKWAINGYNLVQNAIRANITGKVLKAKPGGKLFQSLLQVGRIKPDGFIVGTNVIYGIAWEFGFHRKAIRPAPGRPYESEDYAPILPANNPRARLRFNFNGAEVFAREIPAATFAARPFIRPAITDNMKKLSTMLKKELAVPLKAVFGAKITLDIRRTE